MLALLVACSTATAHQAEASKVVYYGWKLPDAIHVAGHAEEMENAPLDGTGIVIPIDRTAWAAGRRDTDNQLGWKIMGPRRFAAAEFAQTIAELGHVRWNLFTDNFLPIVMNTAAQRQGFSWFDDDRWDAIVQNWEVVLKIARRAKCRGLILDPEDYGGGFFDYGSLAAEHPAPFADYQRIVRARARQLMERGRRVFPGLVILGLFGSSLPIDVERAADLPGNRYGLLASFVDGLVEGADPDFTFVDGGEYAYTLRYVQQFASLKQTMTARTDARSTLSPPERARLSVGFGLWIDNGGRKRWFPEQPWRNYFTPVGWEGALRAASRVSDGYVWIYSQEPGFFPLRALPTDYVDAMRSVVRGERQGAK